MQISSNELVAILSGTLPGAAPLERSRIETSIDFIHRKGVTARTDSESSQFLCEITTRYRSHWNADVSARFSSVDIYAADIPVINAFARLHEGQPQIVVCDGIRQVSLFYADFITVLNLLQTLRPDHRIVIDGWEEQEALAFSLAGFSLLYEYIRTGSPLIAIGDILGPNALRGTRLGYQASLAFLLAHELGHHVLGHTGRSPLIAERNQPPLAIGEEINRRQQQEFEADSYALFGFHEHLRVILMSSVIFYFGPMAFMEAFARPSSNTHPLYTNRTAHLASLLPEGATHLGALWSIIEGQVTGFKEIARLRGPGEVDIRNRIHSTMPVALAYRVIAAIKARVVDEIGHLEPPASSDTRQ